MADRPLDRLPEAVLFFDPAGNLVDANRRAEMTLGPCPLGTSIEDVLPIVDDEGAACDLAWLRAGESGRRLAEVHVKIRTHGRARSFAVSGQRDDDGLVLTLRPAGRRVAQERASSELIATVSHEIRSPLTSVKGFTSTMLRRWDRFSDEQKRAMLETINHDADRVTRLLKELLAVSRIDSGRVEVHCERVDLVPLVEGIVDRFSHREDAASRPITIELVNVDIRKGWVDQDKLIQVFTNLIDNALNYGGESPIHVAVTDAGGDIISIAVSDDGPGIPVDQQKRIFDKFGRGKNSRRAGTGLGLYISKGLVEAMGGRIVLTSARDEGAMFDVQLPPVPD